MAFLVEARVERFSFRFGHERFPTQERFDVGDGFFGAETHRDDLLRTDWETIGRPALQQRLCAAAQEVG